MAYLVAVLSSLALLVGFAVLTLIESRRGVRFFEAARGRFDKHVGRIEFIIEHVDLVAFAQDETKHAVTRLGHVGAHYSLHAVRCMERLLTRLVRYLRTRHQEEVAPRETAREFVKTLSEFKDGLKATHPDIGIQTEIVE